MFFQYVFLLIQSKGAFLNEYRFYNMKCISDKYKNLLYTSSSKYLESAHMNTTIIVYSLCCALPLNMKERRETKKLCYRATTR